MPGYREIMALTGFKSKNAVYKLLDRLVEAGLIEKDKSGKIIPITTLNEARFLGLVEAGLPTDATQETFDTIDVSGYLIRKPEETYLLEVKGNSMIDAGIREKDLVIAERAEDARDGDIVIAEMDGGWTMKYLRKRMGKTYLEPANKTMDSMHPKESLRVAAVVRGIIRRY